MAELLANDEMEIMWKRSMVAYSKTLSQLCGRPEENHETFSRISGLRPPEYQTGVLTTQQRWSVLPNLKVKAKLSLA